MNDSNAREALGLLKDEDVAAYLTLISEAHEEIEDERMDARIQRKLDEYKRIAKERKMVFSGGLVFRWGIITAHESDLMREALIETTERNAALQQRAMARRAELKVEADNQIGVLEELVASDAELKAIALKIGRENLHSVWHAAALTIRGMGGELKEHNPDAAECSTWPPLPLDDYRDAIEQRVAILRQLDNSEQQTLFGALQAHRNFASGLDEDESKN